jgi:hypothetical protein
LSRITAEKEVAALPGGPGHVASHFRSSIFSDKEKKATAAGDGAKMKAERAAKAATEEALECSKAVTLIKEEMIDSLTQFTKAIGQVLTYNRTLHFCQMCSYL